MEIYYILAGLVVGFCVGVTGVGAGSLMTPILIILLKVEPHIAIGTDLLYAAISKFFGSLVHAKQMNVVWSIVVWLAVGSIPASIVTNYVLENRFGGASAFAGFLTLALGVMLMITGLSVIFRPQIERFFEKYKQTNSNLQDSLQKSPNPRKKLVFMGVILGVLVTLSSVGAGAFGLMALVLMFPQLPMIRVIGSDVVHAVMLTFIAGMGHLFTGNVDFSILLYLLMGSIPAIIAGTLVAGKLPEKQIRSVLGFALFFLGVSFIVTH